MYCRNDSDGLCRSYVCMYVIQNAHFRGVGDDSFFYFFCVLTVSQLVFNPKRRIGVVEALEHPYLADLHAQVRGIHRLTHAVDICYLGIGIFALISISDKLLVYTKFKVTA